MPTQFPPPLFPETTAFSLAFLDDAQIRSWRTVKRFPKNSSFVFDIVVRLHRLGLATSTEWYNEIDPRTLSNLYFETLQNVVAIQTEEPWNASLPGGSSGQEAGIMFRVWAAGLPLFVRATLRHIKARLGHIVTRSNHEPAYSRIRALLEGSGGYHTWPRGRSLEPVLATIFYCVESCDYNSPWRPWFVDTLRRLVEMLKLKSVEEFKKTLDFFPYNDDFKVAGDELWVELTQGRSGGGTPSLTFTAFSPMR